MKTNLFKATGTLVTINLKTKTGKIQRTNAGAVLGITIGYGLGQIIGKSSWKLQLINTEGSHFRVDLIDKVTLLPITHLCFYPDRSNEIKFTGLLPKISTDHVTSRS